MNENNKLDEQFKVCPRCNMKNMTKDTVCVACGKTLVTHSIIFHILRAFAIIVPIIYVSLAVLTIGALLILGGTAMGTVIQIIVVGLIIILVPIILLLFFLKRLVSIPVKEQKETPDEIKELLQPVKEARQVYYDETKYQNTEKKACSSCGAQNVVDAKLCFVCGTDIDIEVI